MIIDSNIISLLQFNNQKNLSDDPCENMWKIYNSNLCLFDDNQKKFGNGSCKIIGYAYLYTNKIDLKELFKNNLTIDFWVFINKWVNNGGIFSCSIKENFGISLVTDKENSTIKLIINSNNEIYKIILEETLDINNWHHIVFSKYQDVFKYFVDGNLKYEILNFNIIGLSDTLILGNYHHINPNSDNFKGNIDEFIIRNTSIYHENVIVPNSEYIRKSIYYFKTNRKFYSIIKNQSVIKRNICKTFNENNFKIKRSITKNYKILLYYIRRKILLGDLREFGRMNIAIKYDIKYRFNINCLLKLSTTNQTFKKLLLNSKLKRIIKKYHIADLCRHVKNYKIPKFRYFLFETDKYF